MTVGETKFSIVNHLYRYGPRKITELSKSLHMSRQKIHYNITQLIHEGVVRKDKGKYYLQPLFSEESSDIYLKFVYLMMDVADYIDLPSSIDLDTAIASNFEYYVMLNLSDIVDMIKSKPNKIGDANG